MIKIVTWLVQYLCQFEFVLDKRLCQFSWGFALLFRWPCSFCQKASAVLKCGETILNTYQYHPGWNFHYKSSTNPKKVAWIVPITKSFKFTFLAGTKNQTPMDFSRVLHPSCFFFCRIREISKISDATLRSKKTRYFASYKKKSVRLPMVDSRGKNWWERENPWDGGPRWKNQPHEYTWKLTWLTGRSPYSIGITSSFIVDFPLTCYFSGVNKYTWKRWLFLLGPSIPF